MEKGKTGKMEKRAPEDAPEHTPILVWVRDVIRERVEGELRMRGAWRMGFALRDIDGRMELRADGCMGCDVPFWHPLPDDVE